MAASYALRSLAAASAGWRPALAFYRRGIEVRCFERSTGWGPITDLITSRADGTEVANVGRSTPGGGPRAVRDPPGRSLRAAGVGAARRPPDVGFVTTADEAKESWSAPGNPRDVAAAFAGFAETVIGIIDRIDTTFTWGLYDREPLPRCPAGRPVALRCSVMPRTRCCRTSGRERTRRSNTPSPSRHSWRAATGQTLRGHIRWIHDHDAIACAEESADALV